MRGRRCISERRIEVVGSNEMRGRHGHGLNDLIERLAGQYLRQYLEQILVYGQLELGYVQRDLIEEISHRVGDAAGAKHERLEQHHDRVGDRARRRESRLRRRGQRGRGWRRRVRRRAAVGRTRHHRVGEHVHAGHDRVELVDLRRLHLIGGLVHEHVQVVGGDCERQPLPLHFLAAHQRTCAYDFDKLFRV